MSNAKRPLAEPTNLQLSVDECADQLRQVFENDLLTPFQKREWSMDLIRRVLPQWVSVEERLPERSDGLVIAFVPPNIMGTAFRRKNKLYWPDSNGDREAIGVTHWQPLPSAPKEDGRG